MDQIKLVLQQNDVLLSETNGISITLVFVDSTQGWLVTDSWNLQSEAQAPKYIDSNRWN